MSNLKQDFYVVETRAGFNFEDDDNLIKKIVSFDQLVSEVDPSYFLPFSLLPIPPDFPPEFPRLETYSNQKHSQIQISKRTANLVTEYDDSYRSDLTTVENYLFPRVKVLSDAINSCEKINYFAFQVVLIFPSTNEEIFHLISEIGGVRLYKKNTRNFQISYSELVDEKYYCNFKINKASYNFDENPDKSSFNEGLLVHIDLNTKPLYENELTDSSWGFHESMFKWFFELVNKNSLENYICGQVIY